MPILATETWWLTQDGNERVPDGDPRAAVLLIHKGCVISEQVQALLAKTPELARVGDSRGQPFQRMPWVEEKAVLNPPSNKALMLDAEKRKKA